MSYPDLHSLVEVCGARLTVAFLTLPMHAQWVGAGGVIRGREGQQGSSHLNQALSADGKTNALSEQSFTVVALVALLTMALAAVLLNYVLRLVVSYLLAVSGFDPL